MGLLSPNSCNSKILLSINYDLKAKLNGNKPENIKIDSSYIELMYEFQRLLRRKILRLGIAIECNPTSNVLIGAFETYDKHPILAFNKCYLVPDLQDVNLMVALNTDDIGVFDTSLRNEYALLLCALQRSRYADNNFNTSAIYDYVDYLRKNSFEISFFREKE